jgi:hypothetical protein
MWIYWAPFSAGRWSELCTGGFVQAAAERLADKTLGPSGPSGAATPDRATCEKVAERLWLMVLSEKQERLTLTARHLGVIRQFDAETALR